MGASGCVGGGSVELGGEFAGGSVNAGVCYFGVVGMAATRGGVFVATGDNAGVTDVEDYADAGDADVGQRRDNFDVVCAVGGVAAGHKAVGLSPEYLVGAVGGVSGVVSVGAGVG